MPVRGESAKPGEHSRDGKVRRAEAERGRAETEVDAFLAGGRAALVESGGLSVR